MAAMAACTRGSPPDITTTLHSVSSPSERLLRLDEPMVMRSSSITVTLLCTLTHSGIRPGIDGQYRQKRSCVSAARRRRYRRARSTPMLCASSQPLSLRLDTSTISGPSSCPSRASSALAISRELKYWFSM
ncbi:hypothetical protein D3C72_2023680 [compost metagenome]